MTGTGISLESIVKAAAENGHWLVYKERVRRVEGERENVVQSSRYINEVSFRYPRNMASRTFEMMDCVALVSTTEVKCVYSALL